MDDPINAVDPKGLRKKEPSFVKKIASKLKNITGIGSEVEKQQKREQTRDEWEEQFLSDFKKNTYSDASSGDVVNSREQYEKAQHNATVQGAAKTAKPLIELYKNITPTPTR